MPLTQIDNHQKGNTMIKKINDGNKVVIIYRLNGCSHCENFMNTFLELFRQDSVYNRMCNIFDIEYGDFKYLEPRFTNNINAFPYIVSYEDNKIAKEFTEPRTPINISRFLLSTSMSPSNRTNKSRSMKSNTTQKIVKHTKKYSTISKSK
jgi:hypothetical protein